MGKQLQFILMLVDSGILSIQPSFLELPVSQWLVIVHMIINSLKLLTLDYRLPMPYVEAKPELW